jgi:hypothetical protein
MPSTCSSILFGRKCGTSLPRLPSTAHDIGSPCSLESLINASVLDSTPRDICNISMIKTPST